MRIKILNCQDSLLWYNKHIGNEFAVEYVTAENSEKLYWVREGGQWNCINFIKEKDCEELNAT